MKILLVDDDEALCELLSEYLNMEGFQVSTVHNGKTALETIQANPDAFDAIILDVMLPGMNGFDVLKSIPPNNHTPVLMLTARGEDTDTVLGLELGADDYISKPVSPRVLIARLRAIIRRGHLSKDSHQQHHNESINLLDLRISETSREVFVVDKLIPLTSAEFNLLLLLVKNAGNVVSKEILAAEGLGSELQMYDRRIETHIAQIRRKLGCTNTGGERIKTIRGVGYQYVGVEIN